jgi:hypothetical protein
MKRIIKYIAVLLTSGLMFASCEDVSDMAIERTASPVLVEVGGVVELGSSFSITTTIYELDKSGILNKDIGIDSLALPGLAIEVVAISPDNIRTVIDNLTTDANGEVILSKAIIDLDNISSLEWTGQHKGASFTKISKP